MYMCVKLSLEDLNPDIPPPPPTTLQELYSCRMTIKPIMRGGNHVILKTSTFLYTNICNYRYMTIIKINN